MRPPIGALKEVVFEMGASDLMEEVMQRYCALDQEIRVFQLRTGLRCPDRCGICCDSPHVEATVLECLPLAREIFWRKEEERISLAIEKKAHEEDLRCVLFVADHGTTGLGGCAYYPFRPLVCRLFGYAARRAKTGRIELCPCKVILEFLSEKPIQLGSQEVHRPYPPIYQDSFFQIAAMSPEMGFRLLPINAALKAALDYVYWQRPKGRFPIHRKAA
jgi:Fe-S-cluster containining protein